MKYFVPTTLVLALILSAGCFYFHRKGGTGAKPVAAAPELPPATAIQVEYRTRWVERRIHELLAAGTVKTEDEARVMATDEYAKQHPFINPPATPARR